MIIEKIPLREIAYARSGDKGPDANIGLIAYQQAGYQFLVQTVTPELVKDYFLPLGVKRVRRYELPNLWALNFILEEVLEGGASLCLRADAQGKAFGERLLELKVEIPEEIYGRCRII